MRGTTRGPATRSASTAYVSKLEPTRMLEESWVVEREAEWLLGTDDSRTGE